MKDLSDWREGTLDELDNYFELLRYTLDGIGDVANISAIQMTLGNDHGYRPAVYEKIMSKEADSRLNYMHALRSVLKAGAKTSVDFPNDYSQFVKGKNRKETLKFASSHNLKLSDAAKKKGEALHKEALVAVKAIQRCEDLLHQIIGGMKPKAATNKKKTARRRVIRR